MIKQLIKTEYGYRYKDLPDHTGHLLVNYTMSTDHGRVLVTGCRSCQSPIILPTQMIGESYLESIEDAFKRTAKEQGYKLVWPKDECPYCGHPGKLLSYEDCPANPNKPKEK